MGASIADEFGVKLPEMDEIVVPNDLRSAKLPEDRILRELQRHGYDPDITFAIKLALEEAMTNAVKHGNRNDCSKHITVRFRIDAQRTVIMVRDEGCGFCPDGVPDCTAEENLERPNGRGIMLMHSYMSKVRYNDRGNEVWMMRLRTDGKR